MRRLLLLTLPVLLFACVAEGAAEAHEAVLTVSGTEADASALHVSGRLENAPAPPVFRLRTELGCAHDTTLEATRTGAAFSLTLDADALADAFACAIDVEAADASLPPVALTPDAVTTTSAEDLRLDPSFFAVVAADLDARSGHVVRFHVVAGGPLSEAHATLEGVTYTARIAPADEAGEETMAIFEVPARAWAAAVIDSASADVVATLETGKYSSIVLRPAVRAEALAEDANDADPDLR